MLGMARCGLVRLGTARHGFLWNRPIHNAARPGMSLRGKAMHGEAMRGKDFSFTGGFMKTIKAAEIVLDFDLYPRNNVDSHNVRNLVDAMAAGAELPPVIIDRKSKRAIDGFHRVRAKIQFAGPDATIEVIEKSYADEKEMFLDAMRYNSAHGAKLDTCDRVHCAIIAERLQIPLDAVAGALHMPADKLGELHVARTAVGAGGLSLPLKRTVQHMAGRKLTKNQIAVNERSSGMNQVFYVNQIIDLCESKMLNLDDNLIERLRVLHGLLDEVLAAK